MFGCIAGYSTFSHTAFALPRDSYSFPTRRSSDLPRFSDMLFSPPVFRLQVNRMTQEHPSGLLLTESGIQRRVPRRKLGRRHVWYPVSLASYVLSSTWLRHTRSAAPRTDRPRFRAN